MQGKTINFILRKGVVALKNHKQEAKEVDRFVDIYKTVYKHARKKGQKHKKALTYCWNVYSEQAPSTAKKIIMSVVSGGPKMKNEQKNLRKMILKEMLEGEIIKMSDFRQQQQTQEPKPDTSTFESFLSEMHHQMIMFMEEEFDNMTPEQVNFLDGILDSVEDILGIEEEGIDFDDDDEFEDEDL